MIEGTVVWSYVDYGQTTQGTTAARMFLCPRTSLGLDPEANGVKPLLLQSSGVSSAEEARSWAVATSTFNA
jgi:hypothetical protein